MLEAPFCEVSTPVCDLAPEAATALRRGGYLSQLVFGFLCAKFELAIMWPTEERIVRVWPKYKSLMKAVRHAIFIQPFTMEIEKASQEQVDEETGAKLIESLKRHVDEGQAMLDERRAADEAHEAKIQAQDDRAAAIFGAQA